MYGLVHDRLNHVKWTMVKAWGKTSQKTFNIFFTSIIYVRDISTRHISISCLARRLCRETFRTVSKPKETK